MASTSYEIPLIDGEILQYDRRDPLGKAPNSSVYKGYVRGRTVAAKVYNGEVSGSALVDAVRILNELDHAHIAEILGVTPPDAATCYLVSEYYPNGNVREYIELNPHSDRRQLLYQIASGMAYLHSECNIIHGSLWPSNILIDDQGGARISEASLLNITQSQNSNAHQYYSPEAWKGTTSKASDVYAFAMVALEIFSGTAPWGALSEKHVYQLVVYEITRPDRLEPDQEAEVGMTNDIWNILENAWHPDGRLRPSFKIISRLLAKLNSDVPPVQRVGSELADMSLSGGSTLGRSPTTMSRESEDSVPPAYELTAPQTPSVGTMDASPISPRSRTSLRDDGRWDAESVERHGQTSQRSSSWTSRPRPASSTSSRRSHLYPAHTNQRLFLPNVEEQGYTMPASAPSAPGLGSGDLSPVWAHNADRRQIFVETRPASWDGAQSVSSGLQPLRSINQQRNAILLSGALQTQVESTHNRDAVDGILIQIRELALQSDKDAEKLVTAGIIPTLIRLLKIRAAEPDGLEIVLITLGLLAYDSISANTVFRTNTTHTLIELFKASISENISTLSLWCLNRICRTADVASGLIKQNLPRLLVDIGLAPRTAASTSRMAAWTLGILVFNDAIAETVNDMGVISEVVNYLNRVSAMDDEQPADICAGMYAIGRVSRSIKLAKAITKAGCIPLLAKHLSTSTDPDVLMWTARSVGCLMRPNSGDMAKALLDAGIAHGLARLPSVLPTDVVQPLGSFAFAVQRFSCAEWGGGVRKALVEAGVVDALLAGLRTVADEPHPQIHIEMALAVSFLGDVGGGAIRKEIVNAGGIVILKRVGANGSPEVAKACAMAVTSITGNLWSRNTASAKTAMSHNWSGGCPDYYTACPVPLFDIDDL